MSHWKRKPRGLLLFPRFLYLHNFLPIQRIGKELPDLLRDSHSGLEIVLGILRDRNITKKAGMKLMMVICDPLLSDTQAAF